MRMLAIAACLLAGACAPEVVAGAYYCGPEGLCPDDLVCDGETNICVAERDVTEFACGDTTETEPNDSAATAPAVGEVTCTSRIEAAGCVGGTASDVQDFFGVSVPGGCGPRKITAQLFFPVAFEALDIELADTAGTAIATEQCPVGAEENGQRARCVSASVGAGETFVVRAFGTGTENCSGACAYNRYSLVIQLGPQ